MIQSTQELSLSPVCKYTCSLAWIAHAQGLTVEHANIRKYKAQLGVMCS